MPLLAPLLVLPPLLVLGVLMPDAEVPVLGLAAVPELFSEGNAAFGLYVGEPGCPGRAP